MVQPVMMSMGRTAKMLKSSGNRVLSETFKDNKGVTTVVTKVFDSNKRLLKTRMKRLSEILLKSGKKVLTRENELHYQEKIAGTETPKLGSVFTNKLFTTVEKLFSNDNKVLLKVSETYKKPCGCEEYIDKIKFRTGDKLSSTTNYNDTKNVKEAIRSSRIYLGADAIKLEHETLDYNEKGLAELSNQFNLNEFEIFNR